jgi:hypothetical protein
VEEKKTKTNEVRFPKRPLQAHQAGMMELCFCVKARSLCKLGKGGKKKKKNPQVLARIL